jgi:hypothetical protein
VILDVPPRSPGREWSHEFSVAGLAELALCCVLPAGEVDAEERAADLVGQCVETGSRHRVLVVLHPQHLTAGARTVLRAARSAGERLRSAPRLRPIAKADGWHSTGAATDVSTIIASEVGEDDGEAGGDDLLGEADHLRGQTRYLVDHDHPGPAPLR